MIYLRIIGFLLAITALLGVDRYLDSQHNFSLFREAGKVLKVATNNLLTIPEIKSPLGGKSTSAPKVVKEIGDPCNSLGKCDKAGEICEPTEVNGKTELRCVSTPTPEKPESSEVTQPVSGSKPTQQLVPKTPSTPITDNPTYGKGKVRISSASVSFSSSYPDTIIFYTSLSQGETLNLGGWKLKTKKEILTIPKAVETYDPYGFNSPADIVLKSGDYLYIYSNASPIAVNFRINKCLGYLQNFYNFTPSLSLNCPRLYESRRDIVNLTTRCQDYITSLSSCAVPSSNPPISTEDSECREFLKQASYGSCFNKYRNDSDFLSREWRVYLGNAFTKNRIILETHDKVQLLNKAGTLIDEYIY